MTLINLPHPIVYPMGLPGSALLAIANSGTMDAAGEYIAQIFRATQAMTISHVGFRPATVAGGGTADLRIETVAADGTPSGSLWAANTNIAGGALSSNTWTLQALTASASISAGDMVCYKIGYNSGTSFQISGFTTGLATTPWVYSQSYKVTNTGTPTKAGGVTMGALGSNATTFYHVDGLLPATTETDTDFNSGSGTIRYGIRFKLPFAARIAGFTFNTAQTGDFTAALYSDAGSLLASVSVDGDTYRVEAGAVRFSTPYSASKNTWYRATVEATTVTNQEVQTYTLASADYIGGCPWVENAHLTTWNGSAWDDTNTSIVPMMGILIDQIDDGSGSGGGTKAYAFA